MSAFYTFYSEYVKVCFVLLCYVILIVLLVNSNLYNAEPIFLLIHIIQIPTMHIKNKSLCYFALDLSVSVFCKHAYLDVVCMQMVWCFLLIRPEA